MRPRPMRLAGSAAAAAGLLVCGSAEAATIAPTEACYRYVPDLAGKSWVGLTGSGFTPGTDPTLNGVRLDWPDSEVAGFTPLAADGSFSGAFSMPIDFIRRESGFIKRYTITAIDKTNPAITAATELTFVRAGVSTKPRQVRGDLHRRVRWSAYGAPTGSTVHAHWTFKGRRYATRTLGRAKGACGVAHKRLPLLPPATRRGTWRIYFTGSKRLKRGDAFFRLDLRIT